MFATDQIVGVIVGSAVGGVGVVLIIIGIVVVAHTVVYKVRCIKETADLTIHTMVLASRIIRFTLFSHHFVLKPTCGNQTAFTKPDYSHYIIKTIMFTLCPFSEEAALYMMTDCNEGRHLLLLLHKQAHDKRGIAES